MFACLAQLKATTLVCKVNWAKQDERNNEKSRCCGFWKWYIRLEHSLGGGYGYVTFKFVTRLVQELHNVVSNVLDVRRDFPK